jgi:hypothetical protein
MKTAESSKTYYDLNIKATSSDTDIWLADQSGHLVQKETGVLETSVLAGRYNFGKIGKASFLFSSKFLLCEHCNFTYFQLFLPPPQEN